jgi:hypothetical protein
MKHFILKFSFIVNEKEREREKTVNQKKLIIVRLSKIVVQVTTLRTKLKLRRNVTY